MGSEVRKVEGTLDDPQLAGVNMTGDVNPAGTDKVMRKAEKQAEKSRRHGANEDDIPDRAISAVRSPDGERQDLITLPVIGEAAENGSSTSAAMTPQRSKESLRGRNPHPQPAYPAILNNAEVSSQTLGEVPPPTPPKSDGLFPGGGFDRARIPSRPPPTPPKDDDRDSVRLSRSSLDKDLPPVPKPQPSPILSATPVRASEDDIEHLRARIAGLTS